MSYIAELQETLLQFIQDLKDGAFDDEPDEWEEADEDEVLEQTIRDYNDSIAEVGGY